MHREDIEEDVGPLQLAKILVVVKGEKVRLIHHMQRNGTNSKVSFQERARSTQANFDLGHRLFVLGPVLLRPGAT